MSAETKETFRILCSEVREKDAANLQDNLTTLCQGRAKVKSRAVRSEDLNDETDGFNKLCDYLDHDQTTGRLLLFLDDDLLKLLGDEEKTGGLDILTKIRKLMKKSPDHVVGLDFIECESACSTLKRLNNFGLRVIKPGKSCMESCREILVKTSSSFANPGDALQIHCSSLELNTSSLHSGGTVYGGMQDVSGKTEYQHSCPGDLASVPTLDTASMYEEKEVFPQCGKKYRPELLDKDKHFESENIAVSTSGSTASESSTETLFSSVQSRQLSTLSNNGMRIESGPVKSGLDENPQLAFSILPMNIGDTTSIQQANIERKLSPREDENQNIKPDKGDLVVNLPDEMSPKKNNLSKGEDQPPTSRNGRITSVVDNSQVEATRKSIGTQANDDSMTPDDSQHSASSIDSCVHSSVKEDGSSASSISDPLLVELDYDVMKYISTEMDHPIGKYWPDLAGLHGWSFQKVQILRHSIPAGGSAFQLMLSDDKFKLYTLGEFKKDMKKLPRKDILRSLKEKGI